ncbi:MAG: hypothetical protein ACXWT3_00840 [Methylococcaceae bacterium]
MKYSRFFVSHFQHIILEILIACPFTTQAANTWSYRQESNPLTNLSYSVAQSPKPRRGVYDNINLNIICKENKLQVILETEKLIASQNSEFTVEYQIDKKAPVKLQMKTFPDSKRKGYVIDDAKNIADDILTGQAIFIRVQTLIKKTLSSSIALAGATEPIQQVFSDCGLSASNPTESEAAYSLDEFEQDFGKLTPEQQQQALTKIKKIIMETK